MIQFAPHNMTQANSPLPWVVSASSYYGQDAPWKAFDGSLNFWHEVWQYANTWWTANTPTGWIQIDCGAGITHKLLAYLISMDMSGSISYAPKSWTMEGSNDGLNWNVLDTRVNESVWTYVESRLYTCSVATTAYRHFRLNVSSNEGGAYLRIGEIYLYRDIEVVGEDQYVDDPIHDPSIKVADEYVELANYPENNAKIAQEYSELINYPSNIQRLTQEHVEIINYPPNFIRLTCEYIEVAIRLNGNYTDMAASGNFVF